MQIEGLGVHLVVRRSEEGVRQVLVVSQGVRDWRGASCAAEESEAGQGGGVGVGVGSRDEEDEGGQGQGEGEVDGKGDG